MSVMTDGASPELTQAEWAARMRAAMKDKSYASTPIGMEVRRYYRWKKNEWGALESTMVDYESVLARLSLFVADLELKDMNPPGGTDILRECWEFHWGERTGRTRAKVRSVWVDFFDWAVRERGMAGNPARALASPKKRDTPKETFVPAVVEKILASQTYLADRLGCELMLRYALRRGELARAQFSAFDFERKRLTVMGKGEKLRMIPVADGHFWRDLEALRLDIGAGESDYLLYHRNTRKRIVPLDQATEILQLGKERRGYAVVTLFDHGREPSGKTVHYWWYRCLERAGLVPEGTTGGTNMHRSRHTAVTEFLRSPHGRIEYAQLLAGHSSSKTTVDVYGHLIVDDLARAMQGLYGAGEDE